MDKAEEGEVSVYPGRVYRLSISPPYSRHCCRLTNVGGRGPRLADGRYQADIGYSTSL